MWTWREHLQASQLLGTTPAREVIFLIDEIEAHLHPQWQRAIIPALLPVIDDLTGEPSTPVQVLVATHSPLVLASVETLFGEDQDAVFHLDLQQQQVSLARCAWAKQGDVTNWFVSEQFGLRQARSHRAERAIEAAEALMRGAQDELPAALSTRDAIQAELEQTLAGHDPFWPRWVIDGEKKDSGEGR